MATAEENERDAIDRIAREWIGTPYHDLGEVKGRSGGTDCAKLLKCVFIEAGQVPPFDIPNYSPQHFLHQPDEHYLHFVSERAREIQLAEVRHGDVVLYRAAKCFCHGAIVIKPGWPNIIHAHYAARCVRRGNGNAVHIGMPITGMKFFSRW